MVVGDNACLQQLRIAVYRIHEFQEPVTVGGMDVRNLKVLKHSGQIKLPTTSLRPSIIREAAITRSVDEFLEAALRERLRTSVQLATH